MRSVTTLLLRSLTLYSLVISCTTRPPIKPLKAKLNSDRTTFKLSWAKNLDPRYTQGNLPVWWTNPSVYRGIVYVGTEAGDLKVYDLKTGKIIRSHKHPHSLGGGIVFYNGMAIYGSSGGTIYARDIKTGNLNYSVNVGAPVESKATIYKKKLFFQLRNHSIIALDPSNGKILWNYKRSVAFFTTLQKTSRPVGVFNTIVVGMADGTLAALRTRDGSVLWEHQMARGERFIDVDNSVVTINGKLWATHPYSRIKVINPKSGSINKEINFKASTPVLYFEGKVYAGNEEGELVRISAAGKVEQKTKISKASFNRIVSWQGHIIAVDTDGQFWALDKTLKVHDQFKGGSEFSAVFGDLTTTKDKMVVCSTRNRLYVFSHL